MPAETYVYSGGAWREAKKIFVYSGGVWRELKKTFIHSGGAWREVFSSNALISGNFGSHTLTVSTNPRIDFQNDGTVTGRNAGGSTVALGNWHPTTVGIGSSYYIRFSNQTGTGTWNGLALNTWTLLDIGRAASMAAVAAGQIRSVSATWEISDSPGGAILASGTVSLSHDRT